jgi:hypothetical protein
LIILFESNTIDPEYANYLASLYPAGCEEQSGQLNPDGTVINTNLVEQS